MSKICACCGIIHSEVPKNAREGKEELDQYPGWYWECQCGSTLFLKKAVGLDQLTPFHKDKILTRARSWKISNHEKVMDLLRKELPVTARAPEGSKMFDPALWTAANWLWFSSDVINSGQRRTS